MPLVSALIAERVKLKLGLRLLPLLTAVGVLSVIHWHRTVVAGAADVRFYRAVQLYAVLALLAALPLPARYSHGGIFSWSGGSTRWPKSLRWQTRKSPIRSATSSAATD
jgi:hypothetical protein